MNQQSTQSAHTTQWALVTGASSGLGIDLAKALAARRINIVLTARSEAPMQQLATTLRTQYQVEVVVEPLDLAAENGAATLMARLDTRQIAPDIVINNAGFGISEPFVQHDAARLRSMLALDVVALTELTHLCSQRMAARQGGYILLVASIAAFQPTPMLAAYGAAKAYVLSLGESLHVELAPKVGVTVICPGYMETGFADASGFRPTPALQRTALTSAQVAKMGINAMFARKSSVVAGVLNRLMTFSVRLVSRHFLAKSVYRMSQG